MTCGGFFCVSVASEKLSAESKVASVVAFFICSIQFRSNAEVVMHRL